MSASGTSEGAPAPTNPDVLTYQAPWLIHGMAWSGRSDNPFRVAIGSFVEEYNNQVRILQLSENKGGFEQVGAFDHPYPTTKVMWIPDASNSKEDLVATTGDYLRLWKLGSDGQAPRLHALFNNNKSSPYCAPLTSFDWSEQDPSIIGTSSIDTTCTIWNVETCQAKTQLIAHDKEVYDIVFSPTKDVFASAGADGSVRMFDLRSLEHSTILYESPSMNPLLRVSWNKTDHNYLATVQSDDSSIVVLDIRAASSPVTTLRGHSDCVNSISWAPHSSCHLASGGDDKSTLIWDLTMMPQPIKDPILSYPGSKPVNNVQWCSMRPEWMAIASGSQVQMLRV